jgi:molybdate transport system substrate-binding protein
VKTINVFCAGAVKSALTDLVHAFEQSSGHRVHCTFGSTGTLQSKVVAGERADIVLLNRSSVDELAHQGKVVANTIVDIGRVGVGIAVRANTELPDVSTPDALRASLRAARSIAFGDPAKGDSSGIHFSKVLEKLGIADEIRDKIVLAPLGLAVAESVDQGKVELGATQATVILACKGITLAGLLPPGLQHITTYALGVAADGGSLPIACDLADYLTAAAARSRFSAAGFAQH